MMSFITFVAFFIVVIAARDTFRATGTASVPETDDESGRSSGHGVEIDTDVLNQIQRRFVERLGLNNIPTPAYRQQLRRVPDFLKQLLAARSRVMTSSCPDQSPLSAVALSPLRMVVTKHGCRSKYDVSRLIHGPRAFNNIELVVARWTTSSPARGTIQLITDGGTMKDRSERLRAPVIRHDGYDRYNLTLFFDGIRRRLSASNLDHSRVIVSWQTDSVNRTNIGNELLVFYDGEPPSNDCDTQQPGSATMETVSKRRRRRRARRDEPSSSSSSSAAGVLPTGSCRLHPWYLDFGRLGWTQWVRYPTGYYANFCSGTCSITPSGATDNSTVMSNHAFAKSLYIAATSGADSAGPRTAGCCVSLSLSPINILYNNDAGQWVMTEMAEMTADQCGCL